MNKIYFRNNEPVVIHDPTPEMIPFIKTIDHTYEICSVQHPTDFVPKFQIMRRIHIPSIQQDDLYLMNNEEILEALINATERTGPEADIIRKPYVSGLDLLEELCFRMLKSCCLCGRKCGVDRFKESGQCGLRHTAHLCEIFTHIAEESPFNPAIVLNLAGCGMKCVYCISHEFRDPDAFPQIDISYVWNNVRMLADSWPKPNSLEFGTGCVESLPWLIKVLNAAPADFNLPVILNCHLYLSHEVLMLLEKFVDVWLPDSHSFKSSCAFRLSGIENYVEILIQAMELMAKSDSSIIVRILVLPGHYECCHKPTIEFLSAFKERIWVSVLGQYVPEHEAYKYSEINRRPTQDEIFAVEELAEKCGLRDINRNPEGFWKS